MNGVLQERIKPFTSPNVGAFSEAPIKSQTEAVKPEEKGKPSFKDVILNANDEQIRKRNAEKNSDPIRGAKSDAEFANLMQEKLNAQNMRKPQNNLDKDAFLKLFVTQMQNQDPLNPDDSAEMAAQLAQFHGLEQMMNVNKNLEKMQTETQSTKSLALMPFVGQKIILENGRVQLTGGKSPDVSLRAASDVPNARLEVRDAAGIVVAEENLGTLKNGEQALSWKGKAKDGSSLPDGRYTLQVVAEDLNGQPIDVKVRSKVRVEGIDFAQNGVLKTDIGAVNLPEIVALESDAHTPVQKREETLAPLAAPEN